MSTRAHIRIQDKDERNTCFIYHHCDGYPEGVGEELKEMMDSMAKCKEWTPDFVHRSITNSDDSYEDAPEGQHGDEEYAYLIDCDSRTLTCYAVGWDEEYPWNDNNIEFKETYLYTGEEDSDTNDNDSRYSDWRQVPDSKTTATKAEIDSFWKVASMKNAIRLGIRHISSADPRIPDDMAKDISETICKKDWYSVMSSDGYYIKQGTSGLIEMAKDAILVILTGVYPMEDGNYSVSGAEILYTGPMRSEQDKDWHAAIMNQLETFRWIEKADFHMLASMNGGAYVGDDDRLCFKVSFDHMCVTVYEKEDGACELGNVVEITDDNGVTLFQYNIAE